MAETLQLISTGTVARHTGLSISGVKKAASEGRIPRGVVVAGRRVWRIGELPAIEEALKTSRRKVRIAAA